GTLELASLHAALGDAYADAADAFLPSLEVRPDLIAVHGQTVAHLPRQATLQLGDASRVALRTGVITIADFRSADIAAGGEGAPLVPFANFVLFADRAPIALLNLGGIANLTLIPTDREEDVLAFDTGPANMVSDLVAEAVARRFDEGGMAAGRGNANEDALAWALGDPYFARRAPKRTGREAFGTQCAHTLVERVTGRGPYRAERSTSPDGAFDRRGDRCRRLEDARLRGGPHRRRDRPWRGRRGQPPVVTGPSGFDRRGSRRVARERGAASDRALLLRRRSAGGSREGPRDPRSARRSGGTDRGDARCRRGALCREPGGMRGRPDLRHGFDRLRP